MWQKVAHWNTLRNQMLVGFVSVMTIVLICAGFITFHSVSILLKNKAEKQIQQTAIQANGRLEAIIHQIDTLTTQAVNDSYLQQLLLSIAQGEKESFHQRQSLLQIVNNIQAYSSGVSKVEVYAGDYRRLYPLDEQSLSDCVERTWLDLADREKGGLVWIGVDPHDRESVLALRRINLIDRWFSNGGYLLIRLNRAHFAIQTPQPEGGRLETMLLVDHAARPIIADGEALADLDRLAGTDAQTVTIGGQKYVLAKQSPGQTGWTLMMLYPVNDITDGVSVLRLAILVSGLIGFLLFVVLSFLISTMITRPILRLMKAMRNTRQGVLTPNPATSCTVELNDLNTTYNKMVDNINQLIKLVYEKEMMKTRTELRALQAQINPHFLYNTLEALYWSLQEKEEELANLVIDMSELFRYVISAPNKDEWVTLGEELEHIERYLRIMSARFGGRLTWDLAVPEAYRAVRMPKLLIQPLVENAILHGLEGKTGQGFVTVRVDPSPTEPAALRITVRDDGPGMDEHALYAVMGAINQGAVPSGKGKGIGLSNVQGRLKLYYSASPAGSRGLTIESKPGMGTTASFEIPIHEEGYGDSDWKDDFDR